MSEAEFNRLQTDVPLLSDCSNYELVSLVARLIATISMATDQERRARLEDAAVQICRKFEEEIVRGHDTRDREYVVQTLRRAMTH